MRPLQKMFEIIVTVSPQTFLKVIAGNVHNYFKLLSAVKGSAGGRFETVNWPLSCSEFFKNNP